MTSAPRTKPMRPPTTMAAPSPIQPPSSEPTIAPVKAPDSIMPSMPMLTTATRSDSTPTRPPSAIGTARTTVASSMPVSENDLPHAEKGEQGRDGEGVGLRRHHDVGQRDQIAAERQAEGGVAGRLKPED